VFGYSLTGRRTVPSSLGAGCLSSGMVFLGVSSTSHRSFTGAGGACLLGTYRPTLCIGNTFRADRRRCSYALDFPTGFARRAAV
jgi:hypothetical protein